MIILCRVHSPPRIGHESNICSYTSMLRVKLFPVLWSCASWQ